MKTIIQRIFLQSWQRKILALSSAIIIWLLVDNSITITKNYPNVLVKLINIPTDMTAEGLMSNGYLAKQINLTLTGSKSLLEQITSDDMEIITDVSSGANEWFIKVNKKNLISKNPDFDVGQHISEIEHDDFPVRLEKLVTSQIPIYIEEPIGEAPKGYHYLEIWPQQLYFTVSGPENQIKNWSSKGINLVFNLNEINKEDLDNIAVSQHGSHKDEVVYYIPDDWKMLAVPFRGNELVAVNDPESKYLHIDFLREELISLDVKIPISLFYPLSNLDKLNPQLCNLATNTMVQEHNGIYMLSKGIVVKDVSRIFADLVKDNIQIVIVVDQQDDSANLHWYIDFVDPVRLEELYVHKLSATFIGDEETYRENLDKSSLKDRFQNFMRNFKFLDSEGQPLQLNVSMSDKIIEINE